MSLEPVFISRFESDGVRHTLARPMEVTVECQDGLWIYHNAELNLWGHGERPEEAAQDLYSSFSYLWRELAGEEDSALDAEALRAKRALLAFVRLGPARG